MRVCVPPDAAPQVQRGGPIQVRPKIVDDPYSIAFQVGGISVGLAGMDPAMVALVPSLKPFRVEVDASDINIRIQCKSQLLKRSRQRLFDSGSVWKLYEDGSGFCFDFNAPAFGEQPYKRLYVDSNFREATLQMNESCFAGTDFAAPLDYPLDELLIMHRLTQEKAIELHGCGIVGADGIGNLFVGHSEAGKSTTTRLWTASQDVEVLSDDRIIVRRQAEATKGQLLMYGTPWHGEAMFASPANAALKRIMVLEHGYGNKLARLSPSQAVAQLFARSFVPFHRHEYVESALEFLEEVAGTIPCYRYAFEPDQRAVDAILNLHD